jgi:hypothetical protein
MDLWLCKSLILWGYRPYDLLFPIYQSILYVDISVSIVSTKTIDFHKSICHGFIELPFNAEPEVLCDIANNSTIQQPIQPENMIEDIIRQYLRNTYLFVCGDHTLD